MGFCHSADLSVACWRLTSNFNCNGPQDPLCTAASMGDVSADDFLPNLLHWCLYFTPLVGACCPRAWQSMRPLVAELACCCYRIPLSLSGLGTEPAAGPGRNQYAASGAGASPWIFKAQAIVLQLPSSSALQNPSYSSPGLHMLAVLQSWSNFLLASQLRWAFICYASTIVSALPAWTTVPDQLQQDDHTQLS